MRQVAKRHFSASPKPNARRQAVHEVETPVDVRTFRLATVAEEPTVFRGQASPAYPLKESLSKPSLSLPALKAWFIKTGGVWRGDDFSPLFRERLDYVVPYELILSPRNEPHTTKASLQAFLDWLGKSAEPMHRKLFPLLEAQLKQHEPGTDKVATNFVRFDAPLALLDAALHFNTGRDQEGQVTQLYIAQAALSDLPLYFQRHIPVPDLLAAPATTDVAFTGDIYSSSLWLGLEPTFTPWHRDPNHNLFVQMVGAKSVRLLPPDRGRALFREVMTKLGKPAGSSAIRGEEMMQGAEGQAWYDAVWGHHSAADMPEVVVRPTDALFVPKGWWHSVKSVRGKEGRLNASVNWWFRWRNSTPPSARPPKVW
jgi:hypothetical protein